MKKNKLIFFALCISGVLSAQLTPGALQGKIVDKNRQAIEQVTITILESNQQVITNELGLFKIGLTPGKYTLLISSVGFVDQEVEVEITGEGLTKDFLLTHEVLELKEAAVFGKNNNQKLKESAYSVDVIDTQKLASVSSDVNQLLNRTSGIRIRENGGLGSKFNFSLNGFDGNQIRFFVDGVPMDNMGTSFQLNNIPVNLIDHIEVYKGVVPIELGGDALGGAVNIITTSRKKFYVDASTSYGSFHTLKSSVNTGYTTNSGVKFSASLFQNYSKNNYWVDAEVANLTTGEYIPTRVRRFHDRYQNETAIVKAGLVDKSFADELMVGLVLGQNKADIQTGNRMFDVYGGRKRKGNTVMPTLSYSKKNMFVDGLTLRVNANYNLGEEQAIDTLHRQYNWLGEYIEFPGTGGERNRTFYKFKNNNGMVTTNLAYQLNKQHTLSINHTFNTFNRKGKDRLDPTNLANDLPLKSTKNIVALNYQYTHNNHWNILGFIKNYSQNSTSRDVYNELYFTQKNHTNHTGYGLASTYYVLPLLQLKASFEKTYRLPDNEEMFGDEINLASNYNLRPESSNNFNLGAFYQFTLQEDHHFGLESNFFYRSTKDYIRASTNTSGGAASQQMVNLRDVQTTSIDAQLKYTYKNLIHIGINATYQHLMNTSKFEGESTEVSAVYKDRIPNIPYVYGNGHIGLHIDNVIKTGNALQLDYNLMYVHEYYLKWPSHGAKNTKDIVPEQFAQDISLLYSLKNGKYNVAFEVRNLADAKLYDNFSLQKPSRSFNVKFRYYL